MKIDIVCVDDFCFEWCYELCYMIGNVVVVFLDKNFKCFVCLVIGFYVVVFMLVN